jgi:WD40 repeat protein
MAFDKMAFDEQSFDGVAFSFDEMVFDQVVDSIRMAFDEVVGRQKLLYLRFFNFGFLIKMLHCFRQISDVCWSSDDKLLVQSGEDKEIRVWDPYNLRQVFSFPKKQYIQSSCHVSADGLYAISTSNGFQGQGCEITVWDLRARSMLAEMYGHEQTVTNAKILAGDALVASCSNDSTVRLWDLKTHSNEIFIIQFLSSK